ncbi:MAG: hypothetical protein JNL42_14355 [Anaerolineae bacterium]|nr:hypothetical protein [Anaerolineae bacterium]
MTVYDRPTLEALIDAARMHLETAIIPAVKGDARLYFQSLVAANILRIAARQASLEAAHLQMLWEGMNALQASDEPFDGDPERLRRRLEARRADLCAAIRAGAYDAEDRAAPLLDHLLMATRLQLEVANPKFLEALDVEDRAGG